MLCTGLNCVDTLEETVAYGCATELRSGGGNDILFINCNIVDFVAGFDYTDPADITAGFAANQIRLLRNTQWSLAAPTIPTIRINNCGSPIANTAGMETVMTVNDYNADKLTQQDFAWWKAARAKGSNWGYVIPILCAKNERIVFDNVAVTGGLVLPDNAQEFGRHEMTITQTGEYVMEAMTTLWRDAVYA